MVSVLPVVGYFVAASAFAQAAPSEPAPAPKVLIAAPAAVQPAPPPAAAPQVEEIPDNEKPAKSQEYMAAMREILAKVIKHLEEAREEKDVVKLNCVNEKLTTIKGLLKISEQADVSLQEAVARKDHEAAVHEFSKISISRQKCEQLAAESEACVGELAVYAGETQVEVELLEEQDSTFDDQKVITEVPFIDRPPTASPYQ
jgi:hypothetical protein